MRFLRTQPTHSINIGSKSRKRKNNKKNHPNKKKKQQL